MYKLIAIDMDGTLLNDQHEVSGKVKETIAEAKKSGVKIVLCSGRPFVGMLPYIEELNLNDEGDYLIAYNGAVTKDTHTGEVVSEISLQYEDLVELYELSVELDTPMHFFDIDQLYTPNKKISKFTILESYLNDMPLTFCPVEEFPKNRTIPNISYIDYPEKLSRTIDNIPASITEKYAFTVSAPHFSEFTHREATKGNAVKKLAEHLGIKQEEVMTIGDNGNDMSMIEYAGCGVAMGNAIPELKEAADYITLSNNENGVAHAIQKFVLDKLEV